MRRARGTGTVFYDSTRERWTGYLDLGYGEDGQRLRSKKVHAKTKAVCAKRLNRLQRELAGDTRDPESVIYFIRNGSRVKIGYTTNLRGRLMSLALPRSAVLFTIPGALEEEKGYHRFFARYRVGRTEWFDLTPVMELELAELRRKSEILLADPCGPSCDLCHPYLQPPVR